MRLRIAVKRGDAQAPFEYRRVLLSRVEEEVCVMVAATSLAHNMQKCASNRGRSSTET
jgi:hypothetical protein